MWGKIVKISLLQNTLYSYWCSFP